ncbi:MAG: OmpA family protein [Bacteroidales bacterium]|nr:MAG: OmpA family protein [Bacteroidales bacterium]
MFIVSMNKIAYLFLFSILIGNQLFGQNLILNPTFDDYISYLDSNRRRVYQPKHWFYEGQRLNHPVYFSSARVLDPTVKTKFHPEAELIRQGNHINYISVLVLPNTQKTYTYLKETLEKGKKYKINVDIKVYNQSNCLSDLIVGFWDTIKEKDNDYSQTVRLPVPDSVPFDLFCNNWITLEQQFVANGDEKIFVISAGTPMDYMDIVKSNPEKFQVYYRRNTYQLKFLVDNIRLAPIDSFLLVKESLLNQQNLELMKQGESIVLTNVFFDFDKYEILKTSYPSLDLIVQYLQKNTNIHILVTGHTDNIGGLDYNQKLSEQRAKSIVDYLISKGIDEKRLQYKGYGNQHPISDDKTKQGRAKNRRIEMQIINK